MNQSQTNFDRLNMCRQKIKKNISLNNNNPYNTAIKKNEEANDRKKMYQPVSTSHKMSISPHKLSNSPHYASTSPLHHVSFNTDVETNQNQKKYTQNIDPKNMSIDYQSPHFKTTANNLQQRLNEHTFIGRALPILSSKPNHIPNATTNKQNNPYSFYQDQVKVLLRENETITFHLNQKNIYIKQLQHELKSTGHNMSVVFETHMAQVNQQNALLKKSSDNQKTTLINEVSKLNQELIQKEEEWQNRVNMIRKINLEQSQSAKKIQYAMQNQFKANVDNLKRKVQEHENNSKIKDNQFKILVKSKQEQIRILEKSIENLQNNMIEQKNSLTRQFQNQIREFDMTNLSKMEDFNLDRLKKQNQLYNQLESRNNHIAKIQQQNQVLKHEKSFIEIKSAQDRSKYLLESKQQKQNLQAKTRRQKEINCSVKDTQMQNINKKHQCLLQQFQNQNRNLSKLIQIKDTQIQGLYQQLRDLRECYQKELQEKDRFIEQLHNQHQNALKTHQQQLEYLKVKLATLDQANISELKKMYEHQITQISSNLIDKQKNISGLNEKITNLLKSNQLASQQNRFRQNDLKIKISQLQCLLRQKQTLLKNSDKSTSNDKQILKENLFAQSQMSQKTAQVKDETISKLSKLVQQKDKQINELEKKILLLKQLHNDNINQIKEQHEIFMKEKNDLVTQLKVQAQYHKKELTKKSDQLKREKQYFSNQVKQLKQKGETDFQDWITKIALQNNQLKITNLDLAQKLRILTRQQQYYKQLWNEDKIMGELNSQQAKFKEQLNADFNQKQSKMTQYYQLEINEQYQPKIHLLNSLLKQKQSQINDMKINYSQLEKKFENMMENSDKLRQLDERVLAIGKQNSKAAGLDKIKK